ncbi:MAG TPA: DUF1775 domain-containing protein [Hypericibacter adhaerens]|uniref:YcnI family copper-binding membrane protein n=1 Tax=Hypericibacter adhaerens TaxID=2602016 RepID=UPI002D06F237|nr:DUF1775 domain-containing protein [Hypericibacter adhaerens]HWA44259.1 DUF1775 domain-containing protein [Hypericibacter adhaerens]
MRMSRLVAAAGLAAGLAVSMAVPALAHITFADPNAPSNGFYRAVLRVPHGCDGSATTAIRIQIPEGFIVAQPMPKPGWQVTVTEGSYGKSYKYEDTTISRGVKEIAWAGGNLPDNFYDEFVFRVRVTDIAPGTKVYFPVVQECGSKTEHWIEIPAEGKSDDDYEYPAPGLTIGAPAGDDD